MQSQQHLTLIWIWRGRPYTGEEFDERGCANVLSLYGREQHDPSHTALSGELSLRTWRPWLALSIILHGLDKPASGLSWQEYAFYRTMAGANLFPAVMGRVCPTPCQGGCNRNMVEEHVGINAVEQFIGDWAIANEITFPPPAKKNGRKTAAGVVGGGPGGLAVWPISCAARAMQSPLLSRTQHWAA